MKGEPMKKILSTIAIVLVFLLGLGILLYPTISNWFNVQYNSFLISDYSTAVAAYTEDDDALEFEKARRYNASLAGNVDDLAEAIRTEDVDASYWDTMDVTGGIMGVLEIPSIHVSLAIYHGSDESVLQKGVGHLEGSALPTGDIGIHTVVTGHTGLPSAELLTDMDNMVIGDTFTMTILNKIFTYEVADIFVVLPTEVDNLVTQKDKNLVTLVTCTPYGVNSHRLLVQGELVGEETIVYETTNSSGIIDNSDTSVHTGLKLWELLPLILVAIVLVVAICVLVSRFRYRGAHTKRKHSNKTENTSQPSDDSDGGTK